MDWFQVAHREVETFFDTGQRISEAERQRRGIAAVDAFHHVFSVIAVELGLQDAWPDPCCHIMPFSTGIIERSRKLDVDFTMGVSLDGWFIEAPIGAPEQIRHMKDSYWQHIVRLSTIGKAELQDYGRPPGWNSSPDVRRLTKHKSSLVFSIARDFTLLASCPEGCTSLGNIHVVVPLEADEAAVIEFFKLGLDSLYRSNYLLYRADYLRRRRHALNLPSNASEPASNDAPKCA